MCINLPAAEFASAKVRKLIGNIGKLTNFVRLCPVYGQIRQLYPAIMHTSSPSPSRLIRRALPSLLSATLLLSGSSCRRAGEWRVAEGAMWNTTYRVVYQAPVSLDDSIRGVMHHVEMSLSPFNPSSLISRINRGETDRTDSLIDSVMTISRDVSLRSHGRFDPTVAPLANLWGFGFDRKARNRADSDTAAEAFTVPRELIDSALSIVGIADCHISDGHMVKKHPATTFNFSAVTKGFGCDAVADMMRRNGTENFMVEIGGEISLAGTNRQGGKWRIQIDMPTESAEPVHEAMRIISLTDCGVATSGNYRNFHDTQRYGRIGHTIDPATGMPVQTDVVSATVTAPTAGPADAWATACMASTADSALSEIASAPGVECLLVVSKGDSLAIIQTPGFPE